MALTETNIQDKIEVIGDYKKIGVRTATVIKKDGVELTRTFNRKVITPGQLDASDNLIDTDVSGESADVQALATQFWTTSVKNAWKAKLIADKTADLA